MIHKNIHGHGNLFIISAPSGAGKTTISQAVLKDCAAQMSLKKVITYTSRQPRLGELNGKDYHFLTPDEFKHRQQTGFFLETTEYSGNLYGSPASILEDLKMGISYLMVTDRPGALVIKKLVPSAILIWLYVDDIATLRQRLEKRGTDSSVTIAQRLELAQQEMDQELSENIFDFHIKNNDFDQAVEIIKKIILA